MVDKVFLISMIIFAIWYSLQPDEIFGGIGDWLAKHLPEKLHNPFFECVVCMAGIYGCALYWVIFHNSVKEWIVVNMSCIGFNAVLSKLFPPHKIEIEDTEQNISEN